MIQKCCLYLSLLILAYLLAAGANTVVNAQDRWELRSTEDPDAARTSGRLRYIVEIEIPGSSGPPFDANNIRRSQNRILSAIQDMDHRIVRLFRHVPYITLEMDPANVDRLRGVTGVKGVVREPVAELFLAESIPLIGVDAESLQGNDTSVVIMDTGIDIDHPFFSNTEIIAEACFASDGTCPGNSDEASGPGTGAPCAGERCDHGTHVAGIAAGSRGGLRGVAPGANIIAIRLGGHDRFTESDVMAGLEHVIDLANTHTIAAINMSFGGGLYDEVCDTTAVDWIPTKTLIDILRDVGVVTVAASGNFGRVNEIAAPACFSSVISVGAVDKHDELAGYSNTADSLDLLAPGGKGSAFPEAESIRSSVPGPGVCPTGECYGYKSGTSMAAPHVTGAWAGLKSEFPDATNDEILEALKQSGVPLDAREGRTRPRIDITDAALLLSRPQVHLDPHEGTHLRPVEMQVWTRSQFQPRDLKVWLTRDGSEPVEDSAAAELVCSEWDCGFSNFITLDQSGEAEIRAKAFFTLGNGRRLAGETTRAELNIREPAPGPTGVQASDGLFDDRVRIKWEPIQGASGYEVFTSLVDGENYTPLGPLHDGLLTEPVFDYISDDARGTTLYYSVRGVVDGFPTLLSSPDAGHILARGIRVSASDGPYRDRVELKWDPASWREPGFNVSYRVFRSTDKEFRNSAQIFFTERVTVVDFPNGFQSIPAKTTYTDTNIELGQLYYYWVIGTDSQGRSPIAEPESGFAKGLED